MTESTHRFSPEQLAEFREILQSADEGEAMIRSFFDSMIGELRDGETSPEEEGWSRFVEACVAPELECAIAAVFTHSESPIEQVLLGAFTLSWLKSGGMDVRFTPSFSDAPAQMRQKREDYANFLEWWETFRLQCKDEGLKDSASGFIEWLTLLEETKKEVIPHRKSLEAYAWGHTLKLAETPVLTPQATIPNLSVGGTERRSLRADFLLWLPRLRRGDPLGVVVECDGFKFHGSKRAFVSDRQRDRALRAAGYDVVRFSGPEIWDDPVAAGCELFDLAADLGKKRPAS